MKNKRREKRRSHPSPYRRLELELELECARGIQTDAIEQYLKALTALQTLFEFYDRRDSSTWTAADVLKLAELRLIAQGKR
jgi:hypothetical protein